MSGFFDTFWHKTLRRPYRLSVGSDSGSGQPVVFLHGVGRSYVVWQYLLGMMQGKPYRAIALDLLGFGGSPKPDWLRYDVDDHADAVIATLERLRLGRPAILVGHSMGCLISVHVARLRPDLVNHLILYEMPLYAGLPDKRSYRLRLNFYFGLYKRIIAYKPTFGGKSPRGQRIAEKVLGYKLQPDTWPPFVKSLQNTIMEQTANEDIKHLQMPMDVIYGTKDRLVIRGKTTVLFGEDRENITGHEVEERHGITLKGSSFLLERIDAAASVKPRDSQAQVIEKLKEP